MDSEQCLGDELLLTAIVQPNGCKRREERSCLTAAAHFSAKSKNILTGHFIRHTVCQIKWPMRWRIVHQRDGRTPETLCCNRRLGLWSPTSLSVLTFLTSAWHFPPQNCCSPGIFCFRDNLLWNPGEWAGNVAKTFRRSAVCELLTSASPTTRFASVPCCPHADAATRLN